MEHPSDESVLAYLQTGRDAETLEPHLALCPGCRRTLAELDRLGQGPPSILPRWAWATAAAVLLAATLPLWRRGPAPLPVAAPSTAPASLREIQAGHSVLVTLAGGASARAGGSDPVAIVLERGLLRIESPGEGVVLEAGGLRVELSEGDLLAEVLPAPARQGAWLLREAWASDSPEVRLTLKRGEARIGDRTLQAGESLGEPLSWPWADGWIPLLQGTQSVLESSRILLPAPPAGYLFETLVRKRRAHAEAGLLFVSGGKGWEIPVGDNLLPAGEAWSRIRISAGPSAVRASLGERALLSEEAASLAGKIPSSVPGGVGLRAWGGAIEIREARWKPLP